MKTYSPLVNSKAFTISSSATGLSSCLQIFRYPIGLLSFSWTKWKRSLCSCTALYRRTGTLTRPNEIDPDQIERGIRLMFASTPTGETSAKKEVSDGESSASRERRVVRHVPVHELRQPDRRRFDLAPPAVSGVQQRSVGDGERRRQCERSVSRPLGCARL